MLSVEEALERVLGFFHPLEAEERPLLEALGQTLAEDVVSPIAIPPWPNSAMDGYAVRYEDIRGAGPDSPRLLRLVGQVTAGQVPTVAVAPGTAVRIMTGAIIPPGADTVVPFEHTDEMARRERGLPLDQIGILGEFRPGANIRRPGDDVAQGEVVLGRGTLLRPAEIGVLASLGRATVRVVRRPRVAILATGDELVPPGQPLPQGKIYDVNTYSLAAAVASAGGVPLTLGIARDDPADLEAKVSRALSADLVLTSAGVSKGDYDIVKDLLASRGEVNFWSVRMKPGKPLAFGLLQGPGGRRVPHIGLPGNTVSALVAFELFCRPAIRKMLGRQPLTRPTITAVLEGEALHNTDGRRLFARVWVEWRDGSFYARPTGHQGSHVLTSMARANGLAICPEDRTRVEPGQPVSVVMLDWPEEVKMG